MATETGETDNDFENQTNWQTELTELKDDVNSGLAGWIDVPVKQKLTKDHGSKTQYRYSIEIPLVCLDDIGIDIDAIRNGIYDCLDQKGYSSELSKNTSASRGLTVHVPCMKKQNYVTIQKGDIEAGMVLTYVQKMRELAVTIVEDVIEPIIEQKELRYSDVFQTNK
ncbi:MAG: hypothetical protein GOU99_01405 [Candidatus Altiarchaeota archaeon]|nr:hypothetical protein [Candidatus Altiarchaeota archaeon]